METIQQTYRDGLAQESKKESLISKFTSWTERQEEYRFGWVAAIITAHGCVLTPITLFAIILSDNSFVFWIVSLVAMAAALVTNLAALPTRITIPVFFASIIVDFIIIAGCFASGINF